MFNILRQFASGTSGISALGLNGSALIIQFITFVLAYIVLRRYAFGPILKVLNERRELINKGVNLGSKMEKDRLALEAAVNQALHDARRQADAIIAEAHANARKLARESEEKNRIKAENMIKEAQARLQQDAERMRRQLKSEMIDLVSEATETIIKEKIDPQKDASLIERALRGQLV